VKSLCGLRVLITRPQAQANALADAVIARGGDVLVHPMLRIEPLAREQASRSLQQRLDQRSIDAALFISTNAVNHGVPVLRMVSESRRAATACYAIGSATAARLGELGFECAAGDAAMNSETLLELESLQQVEGKTIVIFKGEGGRPTLARTLSERGATVIESAVYRRLGPLIDAKSFCAEIDSAGVNVALVGSGEALANLCGLLDPRHTGSMWMIVPSQRVADQAAELRCQHVRVAANATDSAMLAALEEASREILETTEMNS